MPHKAPARLPLRSSLDAPDRKARYVRGLFATIADRYDFITRFLSFGRDRHWKARLIQLGSVSSRDRLLDLACGTGDIALDAVKLGAVAVGLDVTPRMVEIARGKSTSTPAQWLVGDMLAVPLAAETFDVVTTGYGLRNVVDLPLALREIHRVLRPGGRFCSLDFDRPEGRMSRAVYLAYLTAVGSTLGWVLHRNPDTYRYIPESIRRYPGARRIAGMLEGAGFRDVRHIPVFGGFMAILVATKA